MTTLELRYQTAISKIGHARLLNLPNVIKEELHNARDLRTKVKLLEEVERMVNRKKTK